MFHFYGLGVLNHFSYLCHQAQERPKHTDRHPANDVHVRMTFLVRKCFLSVSISTVICSLVGSRNDAKDVF